VSRADEQETAPGTDPDHSALLERARAGDAEALQAMLCRHQAALRTYMRLHADPMLRARESCSDMVQSVCRECLQELGTFEFRHEPAFRKWLFQKAMSKIIDRRRYWLAERRDPARELPAPEDLRASFLSASGFAIRNEDLAALEACYDQLPADYRHVITASRLVGLSHAEIAAEMGRNEGAVRMLLNRALARLSRLMREREGSST
jgi:RNA polymerase sigma-70 factor (ECF subfamily)